MNQERFNDIYDLIEEAETANKISEVNSNLRQMKKKMEREARNNRNIAHPDEICPECGEPKGKDVFVCDDCWHTKDQDRLQREHNE